MHRLKWAERLARSDWVVDHTILGARLRNSAPSGEGPIAADETCGWTCRAFERPKLSFDETEWWLAA